MSSYTLSYHRPGTLAEACELGAHHGRAAAYLAGGTELLVDLRSGRKSVAHVIDLGGLEPLRGIRFADGALVIGATARLHEVASSSLVRRHGAVLTEAILQMAGPQVRNLATIGGNFACGVPCSDTPPLVCALGGDVMVVGPDGERRVAATAFTLAPRVTVLRAGEIVSGIGVPALAPDCGASFQRFGLRSGSALAVASVSAWVARQGDRISAARIYMGAVGPIPLAAVRCAEFLGTQRPSPAAFAEAGEIAATEAQPISDLRGSAEFRRHLVTVLTARALAQAWQRAGGGS